MKKFWAACLAALFCVSAFACGGAPGEMSAAVSAEMAETPVKLVYFPGEKLKVGGGSLKVTREDGSVSEEKLTEEMCEADLSAPGKKRVKVRAFGGETEFEVFVASRRLCKSKSVQEAIDEAEDGDVLWLAPGTYHEGLVFDGKKITLIGDGSGSLFIGPKKYEELVEEGGALFVLKNGAEVTLRKITLCVDSKLMKRAKMSKGDLAAMKLSEGSGALLQECRISGFPKGKEILRDRESMVESEKLVYQP